MFEPTVTPAERGEFCCTQFGGYNHNVVIPENEFYHETNLSSDAYPLLQPRPKRAVFSVSGSDLHGLVAKSELCYVKNGRLYYGGVAVPGLTLNGPAESQRFVSMGAKLIVFPNKVYVNTADLSDFGPLEASFTTPSGGSLTAAPCSADGTVLTGYTISPHEPEAPADGALWLDTSRSPVALRCYSTGLSLWEEVSETYVRLSYPGIGSAFRAGDGVTLSGFTADSRLNGAQVLAACGDNFLVVPGLTAGSVTQTTPATVTRSVPDMDFVCESGNRLWGCQSQTNTVYASKLGDPSNWSCYAGVSTDSYAVSVGSDGPFTGAVPYRGSVLFFKENCVHRVYGANPPYTVMTSYVRGVQQGSERSLVVLNDRLYYQSPAGVCCFEGGVPLTVSAALGRVAYTDAVAGALGDKLYLCMTARGGARSLFTYDTTRDVWHREDDCDVREFATHNGNLYFIAVQGDGLRLYAADGENLCGPFPGALAGHTTENAVSWTAETGMWGLDLPRRKYYSGLLLRLTGERGATLTAAFEYDSSGRWEDEKTWTIEKTGTVLLPFAAPRCDHLRLRLSGTGRIRLLSLSATVEGGSGECFG